MDTAPIIIALIAATAAIVGHIVTQYVTYRLKLKEFRVTQIKARIDTLEQALPSETRASGTSKEDVEPTPIQAIVNGFCYRIDGTGTQYRKYKWLLDSQYHKEIERLLSECNSLMSPFLRDFAVAREKTIEQIPALVEKSQAFLQVYENARQATISRLYQALKADIVT